MPSWGIFEHQLQTYRDSVLPPNVKARVAVEQGSILGWDRYVGKFWRRYRDEHFWRVGSTEGTAKKVWLRAPNQVVKAAKEQLKKG